MTKKVAIVQSNYIPWKGYFDLINLVDEFILYDDMQYTRRDWRNRNKIKTQNGLKWLTIPVKVKGKYLQKINETEIDDIDWSKKHWQSIIENYGKTKYFNDYRDEFEELYIECNENLLSRINYRFIIKICQLIGINTKISFSMEYYFKGEKTEKLVDLCKQVSATEYISGPAAKSYINEELFEEANIALNFMDYSGYPEYYQLFPPFEHSVSIIDLILNEGPDTKKFMKSF